MADKKTLIEMDLDEIFEENVNDWRRSNGLRPYDEEVPHLGIKEGDALPAPNSEPVLRHTDTTVDRPKED